MKLDGPMRRFGIYLPRRATVFILVAAVIAFASIGLISAPGPEIQALERHRSDLSRQYTLALKATIQVRDLALMEQDRAAARKDIAETANELAANSPEHNTDLSMDAQLRVFVARLRALSKGEESPLLAGDPRLKGVLEAMAGALGKGLRRDLDEAETAIARARSVADKNTMLLIVLMFGLVVIVGTVLIVRTGPELRDNPTPENKPDRPSLSSMFDQNNGTDQTNGYLQESLLSALDGLDQGVGLFDASDKLVFVTPQLESMYENVLVPEVGQSYETFVRGILRAVDHGDHAPDGEADTSAARNLDEQLSQRLSLPSGSMNKDFLPDGRCLEIAEYGTSEGGRIVLVRDVTGAEHREAVRKLGDARTTAIVDTVFDGVIMINDEGLVEAFNPAAEAIFGYDAADVIGQNVAILMPEGHAVSHDAYVQRYINGGTAKVICAITELQGRRKDGQLFPLEIAVDEVDATWILQERRRTPRRIFIATLRDITEQKAMARQLQQSQKMEAIGTLAGGIAHDFNNILSVILGFTSLTLEDTNMDEEGKENLETVLESAYRARDLVRQILTFSRKGEQEKLRVGMQAVLTDALKLLRSTFPANVEIRTDIEPRDLVVMADPTQMHQVLMNLCTNAGQAMPGGGILEVKLQRVQLDGKTLSSYGMAGNGSCLRLVVRDTGIGMEAATLERVFEPFYTTKPLGAGTGLGLSVVHGIILEHGGHITVDSAPGAGTTFAVYLPLAEPGGAIAEVRKDKVPHGAGRILFVDDEANVVRMADKILSRLGYELVGRYNGLEALRLFRENPDGFDLVITDHSMPDMTGDVLAAELRRIRGNLPIIICTGYSATYTPEIAREAGIDGYLLKPAMVTDLGHVVAEVLANRRGRSQT